MAMRNRFTAIVETEPMRSVITTLPLLAALSLSSWGTFGRPAAAFGQVTTSFVQPAPEKPARAANAAAGGTVVQPPGQPGQPGQPGAPAATPGGKTDGKQPEAAKPTPRPQAPPTPPNPEELKVRPDSDGRVQFNFQGQPWLGVLQWLAEVSGLSLDWQEVPGDFLNLRTQNKYTLDEARDVINRHLLDRGYTLLKQGELLTVVNIKKIDPSLVPRYRPADLDEAAPHEFVRVLFPLDWLKAETAAEELAPLLSPNGKLKALKSTNRIEAIDSAANLRDIRDLLADEQSGRGRERLVRKFALQHQRALDVIELLEDLLGVEKRPKPGQPEDPQAAARRQQQMMMMQQQQQQGKQPVPEKQKPEVHLVANVRENSILANAPSEQMAIIEEAVKFLDVPADNAQSLLRNPGRMQTYRPAGVDPELLVKMLEQVGGLDPTTRLQVDKKNQTIVADASLADHLTIRRLLDNLDGTDRKFEVIKLRRLEAEYVAGTIEFMFGPPKEDKQQNRNPWMFWGGGQQQSQEKDEAKRFRIDADVENNRLLLYANDVEMAEIENLLVKLGEIPGGQNKATVRVLDTIDPEDADELLRKLLKAWPGIAPNPLQLGPGTQLEDRPGSQPSERPPVRTTPTLRKQLPSAALDRAPSNNKFSQAEPGDRGVLQLVQLETEAAQGEEGGPAAGVSGRTNAVPAEAEQAASPGLADRFEPDGPDANTGRQPPFAQRRGRMPPQEAAPIRIGRGPDGRLVISSEDAAALDQFEEFVSQLTPSRRDYKLFRMKHSTTSALYVSWNLEDYFKEEKNKKSNYTYDPWYGRIYNQNSDDGRRLSKRKPLKFIPDSDTNSILVVGADANQLKTIQELIEFYDVPESRDPQAVRLTRTVPVRFSKAKVIADAVKEVYIDFLSVNDPALQKNQKDQKGSQQGRDTFVFNYGGGGDDKKRETPMKFKGLLSLGVDEVSNSVIVSAADGLLTLVEGTIKELDERARPTVNKMQVLQIPGHIDVAELQKRLDKLTSKPKQPAQPKPGQPDQQQPNENAGNGNRTEIRNFE